MSLPDLTRTKMVDTVLAGQHLFSFLIVPGSMYVKDFLKEIEKLNIKIGQEELDEINRISDSTGKVFDSISFCQQITMHPDHESRVREALPPL